MRDEGHSDEEYSDIDAEILQDFEEELAAEDRARRKKTIFAVGGVILGVIVVSVLAGRWGGGSSMETRITEPAQEEAEPTAEETLEAQIAALAEENRIDEDFKAPGALMNGEPLESAAEGESAEPAEEAVAEPESMDEPGAAAVEEKAEETPAPETEASAMEPAAAEDVKEISAITSEPQTSAPSPSQTPPAEEDVKVAALPPSGAPEKEVLEEIERIRGEQRQRKKTPYSVTVTATMDAVGALRLRDDLRSRGFDSWISIGKARKNLYRVELGEFGSIREASGLSAALAEAGFPTRTSYITGGERVTLVAGAYEREGQARSLADRIRGRGFSPAVVNRKGPLDLYIVRVGRYESKAEAERTEETMRRAGYSIRGVGR
ncbi:MAG: SPOR domain-containing protein [Candidatus Nitrospinota bacterium M3_3B_026]